MSLSTSRDCLRNLSNAFSCHCLLFHALLENAKAVTVTPALAGDLNVLNESLDTFA